ncbi:MAG: bifunctional oligoribonuclease/PAP phosphatase NrnA [Thermoguttaceae bacterium]|jgi:phosphoesterase RecJ-like protein
MIAWSPLVESVRGHRRFLLISHVRPDCDALGSQLAMAAILETLGKDVLLVNDFATPANLAFLDPQRKIKQLGQQVRAEELADREVIVVLDTSAWSQLGRMADVVRASRAVKLVMDHHISQDDLGATLLKNTESESTGRLVVEAADALNVPLTAEMAELIFAAEATDTGWFRFSSTSAESYRLAARLVEAGAVPDRLYKQLYEHDSLARLQLIGRTLARTHTELDGRLIYTWIELSDFAATGAAASDTEDIVNLALTVSGVEVAVILVEQRGGTLKLSLRSRSEVDCSRLAEQFAGGGHKRAAGATLQGPLPVALQRILDAVRGVMR